MDILYPNKNKAACVPRLHVSGTALSWSKSRHHDAEEQLQTRPFYTGTSLWRWRALPSKDNAPLFMS